MTGTPRSDMETGPSPPAEKKRLKLRWYQYSLRSLMLFVTACAIACSWLAVTIQNQRKQKAAAEAIETAGGWAGYEQTWLGELLRDNSLVAVSEVTLVGKPETLLENLQGLNQLQKLELRGMRLTETGLVHLEGLRQLQSLCLDYTKVADAGLAHIEGLRQLQGLMLGDTQITDAGLVHVRGLAQLQSLLLENTQVTDAGLVHLGGLSQLKWLILENTQVTDAGLVHLRGLSQLQELGLADTKVTNEGVKKLQQALPNCKIVR